MNPRCYYLLLIIDVRIRSARQLRVVNIILFFDVGRIEDADRTLGLMDMLHDLG